MHSSADGCAEPPWWLPATVAAAAAAVLMADDGVADDDDDAAAADVEADQSWLGKGKGQCRQLRRAAHSCYYSAVCASSEASGATAAAAAVAKIDAVHQAPPLCSVRRAQAMDHGHHGVHRDCDHWCRCAVRPQRVNSTGLGWGRRRLPVAYLLPFGGGSDGGGDGGDGDDRVTYCNWNCCRARRRSTRRRRWWASSGGHRRTRASRRH